MNRRPLRFEPAHLQLTAAEFQKGLLQLRSLVDQAVDQGVQGRGELPGITDLANQLHRAEIVPEGS